tara:strand:- start:860 stop:1036 length:177 start_codon:yes stop_codon:yes gene_type:complete
MCKDRLERIRVGRALVLAIPFDTGKPERNTARVVRARLNVVERDLDDAARGAPFNHRY